MPTWSVFHQVKLREVNGGGAAASALVDFDTDTLKMALVTVANVPDVALDDFWDDLSATEVSGTNYTAGGETLANVTVTLSTGTVTFDNTVDITWSQNAGGFTDARHVIVYKDSAGASSTDILILTGDFGADKGNVAGDLTIEFDANGLIQWS